MSVFRVRVVGIEFRVSRLEYGVSASRFRVSGFGWEDRHPQVAGHSVAA